MKRLLLPVAFLCLACSIFAVPSTVQPTALPSATTAPATATALPSLPPAPATETPLPSATPLPLVINPQTAPQVNKLAEINSPSLRRVVFSPDGSIFATSAGNQGDFGIKTWSTQGWALQQSLNGFNGIVWDIAFSPNGQWLASAADDSSGETLRIWNTVDGQQPFSLDAPATADSLAFSPDGTRLAVGGLNGWPNGVIWIYDTTTWKRVLSLNVGGQNVLALAFSSDGTRLISSGTDGNLRLWSLPDGALLKTMSYGKQANRLALSPDGSLLASIFCNATDTSGCTQGGIAIWRVSDWSVLQTFDDVAESVVFSSDGSLLISASGAHDPNIRIRQVNNWALLRTLAARSYSVAISPDSRLLVSTGVNTISLWGIAASQ